MKEKARHILGLAFLKSGEKNMEKNINLSGKRKRSGKTAACANENPPGGDQNHRFAAEYRESRRGKKERAHSTIYRQRTTGEPYGILRCE